MEPSPSHGPGRIGRRSLLKTTAAGITAASAIAGAIAGCSQSTTPGEKTPAPVGTSASEKIVIGCIGTGDLGRRHHIQHCLLPRERVEIAAVCDVDRIHREKAAQMVMDARGKRVAIYEDYRELLDRSDIDAVLIATPDHWHTLTSIRAIESGKDVYCEKPLTLTIEEGKRLVATARRYGAITQTGSQQRSDPAFRRACELVRNGKIGRIRRIDTVLHAVGHGEWKPVQTPPPELNWDLYLGQAPYVDYCENRVHYQFRWFFDYSGGVMTDWGAHHNDIAQWALDMDDSGPVYVDGRNAEFSDMGPHTVPLHFDVHYKYANGVELYCHTDDQKYDDGTEFGNGVKFTGENGWIFVKRGNVLQASDPAILEWEPGENDVRLYNSPDHHDNWLDCIKSREKCICDFQIGHRSVSVCHMGNISMRLRRPLKWDPVKENFVDDAVASQMVGRPMRAPWYL